MSETDDSQQHDPNLLCELEQAGYQLRLYLENNQMECHCDFVRLAEKPEPEREGEAAETEEREPAEDQQDDAVSELAEAEPAAGAAADEDVSPPPVETFPPPLSLPAAELLQLLKRYNVIHNIDFPALYNFCALIEEGREQVSEILARGIEPRTGEDGWFELMVKTSGEAEFAEDERGNVDLRTRHAFTEIEVGQKIGVLHHPHDGYPGVTAHGLPLPAERGRIFSLVAGDGVELKYDGRVAYAEKAGRAILERQVLSVVDQLVISGDVDFKVGNIDFNGFVEIKGDVLDEFEVKATKGIKINGVAGACRIECNGPLEICSMAGKETGEIICHSDLEAGFLNQVKVECYGSVYVKNEIRNSHIKATGCIIVERGSIIGGSCVALKGIEAKVLGSTSGVLTRLTAGVYFPDADRFEYLRERLKATDEQIKRLKHAIGPLEKLQNLDEITQKRLTILTEQWEKLEVEREELGAELAASTKQEQSSVNPKINVGSELLEGVQISLGESSQKFKIERKGPMSIIENTKDGGFRYLSMSPLQKAAAEIENEILTQEAMLAEAAAAADAVGVEEAGQSGD
jgi:uncharacterized protein (DUF342 family)